MPGPNWQTNGIDNLLFDPMLFQPYTDDNKTTGKKEVLFAGIPYLQELFGGPHGLRFVLLHMSPENIAYFRIKVMDSGGRYTEPDNITAKKIAAGVYEPAAQGFVKATKTSDGAHLTFFPDSYIFADEVDTMFPRKQPSFDKELLRRTLDNGLDRRLKYEIK